MKSLTPQKSSSSSALAVRRVPTLSLYQWIEGTEREQMQFVEQLFLGIREYGFIILKDHPISAQALQEAYGILERFFNQPAEIKLKYAGVSGGQRGYTPFGKEHAKDSPVMDLKEFWHVGREVPEGHSLKSFYPNNVWPEELPEFRPMFSKLYDQLEEVGRYLLQALTHPLEVPHFYFDQMVEDGNSILRLLHYPPIPEGVDPRCLRAAPHEDINLITILPAATESGLQLKDRDGQWLDVESDPHNLIVDAGDMLARITNDVIPSTTHQVVNTAGSKSRFSMPFFMHPRPDVWLSCIPSCKGPGAKYPDITSHDFLMQRLSEIGLLN